MEKKSEQNRDYRKSIRTESLDHSLSLRELINDIRVSEADITAGLVKPLDQAFADMSRMLGWHGPSS